MDIRNIEYLLTSLREQSECIDKQVACIITDKEDNVLSFGWNTIINCNKQCHDKEHRICEVTHAEIIALGNLSKENKLIASKAYVSLYPCIPCQKACEKAGIKEIISFTENHKGQYFENIRFEKSVNDEMLDRNAVDTNNELKYSAYHLTRVMSACRALSNDVYLLSKETLISEPSFFKSIVDMEFELEQIKSVLWSIDPEAYNKLRESRRLRRNTLLRDKKMGEI